MHGGAIKGRARGMRVHGARGTGHGARGTGHEGARCMGQGIGRIGPMGLMGEGWGGRGFGLARRGKFRERSGTLNFFGP
jgi:hypothetical protein